MSWGYAPIPDRLWLPFKPNAAVSAHAVMEVSGTTTVEDRVVYETKQFTAGGNSPCKMMLINGPQDVANADYGLATTAMGHPMAATCSSTAAGTIVGPSDSSWSLSSGHPGFIVAGAGAVSGTAMVLRQTQSFMVEGKATANVAVTASTFTIDNVDTMSGLEAVASSSDVLSVQNVLSGSGNNNPPALAFYNESSSKWNGILGSNTDYKQTVVTNERVNTADFTIQIKTRSLLGSWTNNESDWTTIHTGSNCP